MSGRNLGSHFLRNRVKVLPTREYDSVSTRESIRMAVRERIVANLTASLISQSECFVEQIRRDSVTSQFCTGLPMMGGQEQIFETAA